MTYMTQPSRKKLQSIYNMVQNYGFWTGVLRRVKPTTGSYKEVRKNANQEMIDTIRDWLNEAEKLNRKEEI